ncbi:MAG: c-type cytochrome [Gammaproteobacteria bacterium]|jgi:mono/diheme cytochrome c family protein|nr:c-type cytochrome [Gammaproteobacteria bacterium]
MKHTTIWKTPAFMTVLMLLSSNAFAEYSKSFEGYKVFNANCFVCHGAQGKGDGPIASKLSDKPADLTVTDELSKISVRDLLRIIEGTTPHGAISSDMPKWGLALPQTQITSLVSYVRYLHRTKHPTSGNPVKGKETYDTYCTICHGKNAKGEGIITQLYDMEPANHTDASAMNKISNKKMHSIIAHGTSGSTLMPGWKEVLSDKEIQNIISYIRLISAK